MAGFYAGTVDFDPGAGATTLTSPAPTDVATWVLNADGSLAWARGFGGSNYDQANAWRRRLGQRLRHGRLQRHGQLQPPRGPPLTCPRRGNYDVFVLKLSPTGSTAWADSFAGSNGPAMGDGLGVDATGRVLVVGWFCRHGPTSTPGPARATVASQGGRGRLRCLARPLGNYRASTPAAGAGADMAFASR